MAPQDRPTMEKQHPLLHAVSVSHPISFVSFLLSLGNRPFSSWQNCQWQASSTHWQALDRSLCFLLPERWSRSQQSSNNNVIGRPASEDLDPSASRYTRHDPPLETRNHEQLPRYTPLDSAVAGVSVLKTYWRYFISIY